MSRLEIEVMALTEAYVRKGGKKNRMQQRKRMLAFAALAAGMGAQSMGQVGAAHVIRYWKAHRQLEDNTLYNHWKALGTLWKLAKKKETPPKPREQKPAPSRLRDLLFGRGYGGESPHVDNPSRR